VLETIQQIIQNTLNAWGLTDIAIGTVVSVSPLTIQIGDNDILPAAALLLSDAALPKYIDLRHRHILEPHSHDLKLSTEVEGDHSHAISGRTETEGPLGAAASAAPLSEELGDRVYWEGYRDGGEGELPNVDGVIYMQRALQENDKVALLAVRRRQQYIVLFRIREAIM